jgi:thioredoxin-related protein
MKTFVAAMLILLFTAPNEWLDDIETAKEIARNKNQYILLSFSGSDWCAPCILMKKEIFSSDIFNNYAKDNLVLVQADFPRLRKNKLDEAQVKRNEVLADRYNRHGKFPYTILLNAEGNVIASWEGYNSFTPQQFVDQIKQHNEY